MNNDKITLKEMLIVGAEFICAMTCVPAIIAISTLIVTFFKG